MPYVSGGDAVFRTPRRRSRRADQHCTRVDLPVWIRAAGASGVALALPRSSGLSRTAAVRRAGVLRVQARGFFVRRGVRTSAVRLDCLRRDPALAFDRSSRRRRVRGDTDRIDTRALHEARLPHRAEAQPNMRDNTKARPRPCEARASMTATNTSLCQGSHLVAKTRAQCRGLDTSLPLVGRRRAIENAV